MAEKLLKVSDVGELLDLKPARIYELCREKRLPFVLIGERQYWFELTLDVYSHVLPTMQGEAAEHLEEMIFSKTGS